MNGRPPKSVEDRKSAHFTFRTRGLMRECLQAAAAASGRSVSEEIEYRLQLSFDRDDLENRLSMSLKRLDRIEAFLQGGQAGQFSGLGNYTQLWKLR